MFVLYRGGIGTPQNPLVSSSATPDEAVTAIVELGAPVSIAEPAAGKQPGGNGGLLEAGENDGMAGEVLRAGWVDAGDDVFLEAVTLPLTAELDLHSFRPEDTQKVVTEYLVDARRAGLSEVRIVHGRGRGVQRALIRRVLSRTPGVAGFGDASPTRGVWGATIVRLRGPEDPPPE